MLVLGSVYSTYCCFSQIFQQSCSAFCFVTELTSAHWNFSQIQITLFYFFLAAFWFCLNITWFVWDVREEVEFKPSFLCCKTHKGAVRSHALSMGLTFLLPQKRIYSTMLWLLLRLQARPGTWCPRMGRACLLTAGDEQKPCSEWSVIGSTFPKENHTTVDLPHHMVPPSIHHMIHQMSPLHYQVWYTMSYTFPSR